MIRSTRSPRPSVLVIGEHRQTVVVIRSLARAGFDVTFGCLEPDSPSASSRHVAATWLYSAATPERFLDELERYLVERRPDFVYPVGESALRALVPAAERFAPLATWVHPEPATIARCFDKAGLYELAPTVGVPALPFRRYTSAPDWREAAREMGFPVVVKRNDSAADVRGKKAIVCRTGEELDAFLATLPPAGDPGPLLLQKFHPGPRHNCHVACADGRIVAYFQQAVLSTDEIDDTGIGTAGISVAPSPALRQHCERLTRALGYTGVGCIQFLVDEATGSVGFLEFNPRLDSTAALPYRLGYDYPRIAVALARYRRSRDEAPAALARPYPLGRKYHWLLGDLWAWITAARQRRLAPGALAAWALRMVWRSATSHHLTFDWRDPLPTLHMFWQQIGRRALRRLAWRAQARAPGSGAD